MLSRSLLEAMTCGALVVGSAIAPVQELVEHGETGLLAPVRQRARQHIQAHFQLQACLQRQLQLVDAVANVAAMSDADQQP